MKQPLQRGMEFPDLLKHRTDLLPIANVSRIKCERPTRAFYLFDKLIEFRRLRSAATHNDQVASSPVKEAPNQVAPNCTRSARDQVCGFTSQQRCVRPKVRTE